LAEPIEAARREQAIQECTAREVWVQPGSHAGQSSLLTEYGLGVLVLEGLLIRRVGINEQCGAESVLTGEVPGELLDLRRAAAADPANIGRHEG
jgi:hypothetical protein